MRIHSNQALHPLSPSTATLLTWVNRLHTDTKDNHSRDAQGAAGEVGMWQPHVPEQSSYGVCSHASFSPGLVGLWQASSQHVDSAWGSRSHLLWRGLPAWKHPGQYLLPHRWRAFVGIPQPHTLMLRASKAIRKKAGTGVVGSWEAAPKSTVWLGS